MAKIKYYYDTKTLSYKRIELNSANKLKRLLYFFVGSAFSGIIIVLIFFYFFDSPKEKILEREINYLIEEYKALNKDIDQVELVLDNIQNRELEKSIVNLGASIKREDK